MSLEPDPTDRLVGRGGDPENGAVDIVGSFEVDDETGSVLASRTLPSSGRPFEGAATTIWST